MVKLASSTGTLVNAKGLAKSTPLLSDTHRGSAKEIICSTLEAIQAQFGTVSLINENGNLQSCFSHGSPSSREVDTSVAYWVATHGQPLVLKTREEALLVPDLVINESEALPLICVPIQVHGITLGALQSNFSSVTGHDELLRRQRALEPAATLIGYVIENDALQHKLQKTREALRNANNTSLEIQEIEREHIILEVHDGIAQTLASAFRYLQTIDNIGSFSEERPREYFVKAVSLIRQAIQETREVINSVTPATLDTLGLVPTVRQELKQFEREMKCQVNFRSAAWPDLPKHIEVAIYRIIREAINNIRKHAKSPKLLVELSQERNHLIIRVKDWGIGFAPDKQATSSLNHCIGLTSMQRRADFLGGTFKINSSLGKGTEIIVDIPALANEK